MAFMSTNQYFNWDLSAILSLLRYGASRTGSVFWSVWPSCCWRRTTLCWLLDTYDHWFWTFWSGMQRGSKLVAGSTMTSTSGCVWPSAKSSASVLMHRRKCILFFSQTAREMSHLFILVCKDAGADLRYCIRTDVWISLIGGAWAKIRC